MRKEKYKAMVKEQLKQSSRDIERGRATEIIEDAKVLVNAIRLIMPKNEVGNIKKIKNKIYPNTQKIDQIPQGFDNYGRLPN